MLLVTTNSGVGAQGSPSAEGHCSFPLRGLGVGVVAAPHILQPTSSSGELAASWVSGCGCSEPLICGCMTEWLWGCDQVTGDDHQVLAFWCD